MKAVNDGKDASSPARPTLEECMMIIGILLGLLIVFVPDWDYYLGG